MRLGARVGVWEIKKKERINGNKFERNLTPTSKQRERNLLEYHE